MGRVLWMIFMGALKMQSIEQQLQKKIIHTPLDFIKSAQKLVKEIECVYLPDKYVMIEPDEVSNASYRAIS